MSLIFDWNARNALAAEFAEQNIKNGIEHGCHRQFDDEKDQLYEQVFSRYAGEIDTCYELKREPRAYIRTNFETRDDGGLVLKDMNVILEIKTRTAIDNFYLKYEDVSHAIDLEKRTGMKVWYVFRYFEPVSKRTYYRGCLEADTVLNEYEPEQLPFNVGYIVPAASLKNMLSQFALTEVLTQ